MSYRLTHRMLGIPQGLGGPRLPIVRGLGDVNSDAAAKLTAAGYKGVVCTQQVVNNLGGQYTQNQCTATNSSSVFNADDVMSLSPAELAQQFASESMNNFPTVNKGVLTTPNLNTTGTSFVTGPESPTQAGGGVYSASQLQNDFGLQWDPTQNAYVKAPSGTVVGQTAAIVPASTTQPNQPIFNFSLPSWLTQPPSSSNTSNASTGFNLGASTIINGVPDLVVYGGGALAVLMLVMSMGGHHR